MNNSIHFISLNIERDKHFKTILPFLREQNADVVCLQEVFERDVPFFEQELGMKGYFAITFRWPRNDGGRNEIIPMGVAIFLKNIDAEVVPLYYKSDPEHLPVFTGGADDTEARVLLVASFLFKEKAYSVGTTHFTWTPHGDADDRQRKDLKNLFKVSERFDTGFIFSGDFNAPRGREIFTELSKQYKDNIPAEYITSLDVNIHHAPKAVGSLMVDGLFSTPEYSVTNVSLRYGVSDHAAIVANIEKISK